MFKFNWIVTNKFALGSLPKEFNDFKKLYEQGIKSIICLCSKKEIKISKEISKEIKKSALNLTASAKPIRKPNFKFTLIIFPFIFDSRYSTSNNVNKKT